eukprot:2748451-Pyramimonas_sp.AAC.1
MSKVVLSERQCESLRSDQVTTMRAYASATAKRAVVVKQDDLLTKADMQANPTKGARSFAH